MADRGLRVAIVGAGIGGLSLALALREKGLRSEVFEQAAELTEIGAAIALSANAIREYRRLGLIDELATASTIPAELIYRHWRDGSRIAAHPVAKDDAYVERFGAPYFGIHRADLQTTLSVAFGVQNLHLGCRLINMVERADSVVLEFANGRVEEADIVVGADGVRSTVRRWVTGADDAVYSGTSAFRGLVPVENLPSLPDPHAIQFWMGPDAHLLHYAIGGHGETVNFFAVVETPRIWLHDGSVAEVHEDVPVASFRGWHPAVTEMIKAAASPLRWGLFTVRPLLRWYRGRVVILGDAAHGMLPQPGQVANTSIEDAFALAALLAGAHGDDLPAVFSRYQVMRRARTRKIQRSSWVTSSLLHLPDGPAADRRNVKVARFPEDFGWIHEYDVQQALRASEPATAADQQPQRSGTSAVRRT
jgi:salicylate hydroxylase